MSLDFIKHREEENIIPLELKNKEQYHLDLFNIHQNSTGRIDVLFANDFFMEATQLIINAITLFEKGYFDCAFYSLRQSIEIVTTIIYLVDDDDENRSKQILKWQKEEQFPMHKQMLNELNQRKKEFADLKEKMSVYFDELEVVKQKLNKYVHKQGYDKFYSYRSNPLNQNKNSFNLRFINDFDNFVKRSIGAIAVFRLAIDPLPILLADEDIYKRTGQFLTDGFRKDFIAKYIGIEHINSYKQTEMYKSQYEFFIASEEMIPSVLDIVKQDYVDRNKIDEIFTQKHLLGQHDLVAINLFAFSEKIAKVYYYGGLLSYCTNILTNRTKQSWSSLDFKLIKNSEQIFNNEYDEAFLSYIKINNEDYFIEHNHIFTETEINTISDISCNILQE